MIGGVVLGYLISIALYIELTIRPTPSHICCLTPTDIGFDYQEVSFTSDDGTMLSGWYIPSQNGAAVILLHGYGGNRVEMLERAKVVAHHGYGVLLYDLRAHGESGGRMRTYGWVDPDDVTAALAFLQDQDEINGGKIGILGFSIGGQIALRAAAQTGQISAVIADGASHTHVQDIPPPSSLMERVSIFIGGIVDQLMSLRTGTSMPVGVVDQVSNISPRPIFLIATGRDPTELLISQYYYDHAKQPKILWEIPEAGHGGGLVARPEEYEARIVTFFDEALLGE